MKMTSAEAAKEIRRLREAHDALISMESKECTFIAAIQEDIESVRPAYDFLARQEELARIEEKIRVLKHAINNFNLMQLLPDTDMTIDQALVYIPQLSERKKKLDKMRRRLPKERYEQPYGRTSNIVEYQYANYDVEEAKALYDKTAEELARIQNALDLVNSTVEFEF